MEGKGISIVRKGKSGAEEIQQIMSDFRSNPPKEIAGSKVKIVKDYQSLVQTKFTDRRKEYAGHAATSNVFTIFTEDGAKISIRSFRNRAKNQIFILKVRGNMNIPR